MPLLKYGYDGEYFDSETSFIYLRARYYDSGVGRFISEYPIRSGSNWYVYASNNPVNRIDPSGLVDVMLRYIVEKNGGSVSWNSKTGKTTVNMPGFKPLDVSGKISNGRTVVDSQFLMDNFALTESKATHLEGDEFNSADDAALAFGLMYHQKSKDENQEYGAVINVKWARSGDKFSFNNVTNSAKSAGKNAADLTDRERNAVSLDYDSNSFASIHTHWRADGNLNFSNPSDYAEPSQVSVMYLVNRNFEFMKSSRYTGSGNINGFSEGKKIF